MRVISRLLISLATSVVCLASLVHLASAAETLLYDVTSVGFVSFTVPTLSEGGPVRVEILDNGPITPDGMPRWTSGTSETGGFVVFDRAPADLSAPDMHVFGNHCADIGRAAGLTAMARVVQDEFGGGNFAWLSGFGPDGAPDPFAFFCLKGSHQSTTTYSERLLIGKRVFATPAPPSPVKAFITQPRNTKTVGGTVWVVMWAENTTGSSNTFTLSADGKQVATQTTSSRGPVAVPWHTATGSVPNGTHTLTATIGDSSGNAGTTSITVIVNN